MKISNRIISDVSRPFIIAEIGINHDGNFDKAIKMINDAKASGCECVKFQCHIVEDEMIHNSIVPSNAKESIYDMMVRCSFSEEQEALLKRFTESLGMIYLSTPFSRAAVDRLEKIGVKAYKIGSGECNNYPLVEYIASKGKPIILSTGMNDIDSISISVDILKKNNIDFALLHCTSMYPTPYSKVRLPCINELKQKFNCIVGLSDHSIGNYTSFAAISLGAKIIEKHFTSDKNWSGSDIPISITPSELSDLIVGCNAIHESLNPMDGKHVLDEEKSTIDFAYSSVVSIADIKKGELFSEKNIWVKRPALGEISAKQFKAVLNKESLSNIPKNSQIKINDVNW